ncbi:hypothetical protein [Parafilimonas sp.]|jgi:hypothetical protein|uniref:hypothetical protein n=1 Tax=Parafilimonas sp. TaxID=1969739 RepID=UPI003F7E6D36
MERRNLSELSNEELLREEKKRKPAAVINALFIGFLIGIVIFSILNSTAGLMALIPLFFAYKLMNRSKYNAQELDSVLKERGLK